MADDKERHEHLGVNSPQNVDETVIPVVKEQLDISSQSTVTGEIRVNKTVETETVEVPLTTIGTTYQEHRQPINRVVEQMPQVRYEGDNVIVPVVREEEVVVKRLILVEEIHLIKKQEVTERTESVQLKSEKVNISQDSKNSGTP